MCVRAQSYLTLCDPMDCSPPGCSIHGIVQARILEPVAIFSSRGSSQPRDKSPHLLHWQKDSLPVSHLGSPEIKHTIMEMKNVFNVLVSRLDMVKESVSLKKCLTSVPCLNLVLMLALQTVLFWLFVF